MNNKNRDHFQFDSNDSNQQILPFDFMEEEDEYKSAGGGIEPEMDKKEPVSSIEKDSVINTSSTEKEKSEEHKEIGKDSEPQKKDQLPETVKITDPLKKEESSVLDSTKKTNIISSSSKIKPGQILQEARVRKDLSLDQVSQATKITKTFIEALEQGDTNNLPAAVYVDAYIKNLCSLYEIDSLQILKGLTKQQKNKKVVPGELLHHIEEGKQVNTEEEAKVNKIIKTAAIIILIIAVTIIIAVKTASPSKVDSPEKQPVIAKSETTDQIEPEITSEDLEIFLYHQPFTMTKMDIPKTTTK